MIRFRSTKYDPSRRDSQGHYTVNEFTAASDVGKTFGNQKVTAEDYVFAEDAYVYCILKLLRVSHVSSLRVYELDDRRGKTLVDSEIERLRPALLDTVYDGMMVSEETLDKIVRMALREVIWCKLIGDNGVYVNFGQDYYMYIGSNVQPASLGKPPQGMFYEEMESPYA